MKKLLFLMLLGGGVAGCPNTPDAPSGEPLAFTVSRVGELGARADFHRRDGETVLQATILDGQHGSLTFDGKTIDGDGALSTDEAATLFALDQRYPELATLALDAACDPGRSYEPRELAALLFPFQA